ncbi:MAG: glycerol-3-phosphate 1-O-acyltransferase PlsY [Terriglobia bacterium]|jgi:glycerol-3-phosphate acyltransferase PlsY
MVGPFTALIAYLFGSIPFGYLIVHWQQGIDVRTTGSGSIGATNVMRNLGVMGFAATFLLDFGKGIAAVLLASRLTAANPVWIAAAAVGAILGHCFPVWLKFRGGKGVATAVGVFLALAPLEVGISLAIFAVVVAISRTISLGSIVSVGAFPLLLYFLHHPPFPVVVGAVASAAIIIIQHRSNIRRLLAGTENKLGRKQEVGSRN